RAGLPAPTVRLDAIGLPRDGSWLVKPLASAAGCGIAPLRPEVGPSARPSYFQERIDGRDASAVFVAPPGPVGLLGVTSQWIGRPGAPFGYRGSLGPCRVSTQLRRRVEALGRVLAADFGLLGLFGIDLVIRDEIPWPVEVNPRYTASVEVIELALGRPLL